MNSSRGPGHWPKLQRLAIGTLICVLLAIAAAGGALAYIRAVYRGRIYASVDEVPPRRVAIVFGAGVWPNGQLSSVLEDRVWMAAALYKAGKVEKLLMSGDNRFVNYNEPQHMKEYAMQLGVPESAIVLDYAGRRTYDSCYRARYIFEVPDAILVTQGFHMPRALYTSNRLGLDAVGLTANRRPYREDAWYKWRELPATLVAWWEVEIAKPKPVLGEKLPILPE